MRSPWLLLDVSYLAYRAFFTKGQLSYGDIPTGVVYGVLQDVIALQDLFGTKRVAFCFDFGKSLRAIDYPAYKSTRYKNKSEEELEKILAVKAQIKRLRTEFLPMIGYQNIFSQKGYEADDIIAKIIEDRPRKDFVIVSGDEDLFQLLSPHVRIYNPTKKIILTPESFFDRYQIAHTSWVDVKALAGCSTDDVAGIYGVGPKTAIDWLCGKLKPGKKFDSIVANNAIWQRNLGLVRLPFPGCAAIKLTHPDGCSTEGWQKLTKKLGMNSLAISIPGVPRFEAADVTRATLGLWSKGKA